MESNGEIIPNEETAPIAETIVDAEVIPAAEPAEVIPAAEEVIIVPKTYTEADFIALAKEKGREVKSLEDLFVPVEVEKIVEKEVNPYDGILDDDDRQYLNYKKETGRGRKDYDALNQDFDKVDALVLARELVRRGSEEELTDDEIDEHLERKFSIDLSDPKNLDKFDKIELNNFVKSLRDEKKAEQEKYKQPLPPKQVSANDEIVLLDNGASMKKTDYEAMVTATQQHVKDAIEAVNSVAPSTFKIVVDEDGTQRELIYSYEPTTEDKQSLVSLVSDIPGTFEKTYRSESGFNHKQFEEDMLWRDPKFREKAISSMIESARAEAIEEILKTGNNVNFTRQPLHKPQVGEAKIVPIAELLNS